MPCPDAHSTWRLLGDPSITWEGRALPAPLGKKAIGLIAYLALARDGAGRGELAELLWPPAETARELANARQSLRQCLVSLRKAFGDGYAAIFDDADDWLRLRPGAVEIDVRRLIEMDAGAEAKPEELAALCRGPFLRSLATRSRPFDDWAEGQRLRLAALATKLLATAHDSVERSRDMMLAARLKAAMAELGPAPPDPPATAAPPRRERGRSPVRRRLRWLQHLTSVLAVIVVAVAGLYLWQPDRLRPALVLLGIIHPQPSISVLPFTSKNDSLAESALAGGVTARVTYALYAISDLFVVTPAQPTESQETASLSKRARELGVRYLISGTVEMKGEDVWVFVECFDTAARDRIWNRNFRQKTTEAYKLEDDITVDILKGLDIELSSPERNRIQYLDDTENTTAWVEAAKGLRSLIRVDQKDVLIAKAAYRAALAADPDYAAAHRGLAWAAFLSVRLGWTRDPQAAIEEASDHLTKALAKRPDDGTSLSLQGAIQLLQGNYEAAIESGEAAVKNLPGSADVWGVYAHTLTYVGRPQDALGAIDTAMKLSERHPGWYRWTRGRALRLAGRYAEAIAGLEKDLDAPSPPIVQQIELATSYVAAGRLDDARALASRIRSAYRTNLGTEWPGAAEWLTHPPISDPAIQARELKYLTDAGL